MAVHAPAERLEERGRVGPLGREALGHLGAVGVVRREEVGAVRRRLGAEAHLDGARRVALDDPEDEVRDAEQRVGGTPLGVLDGVGEREERPVHERRRVNCEQRCGHAARLIEQARRGGALPGSSSGRTSHCGRTGPNGRISGRNVPSPPHRRSRIRRRLTALRRRAPPPRRPRRPADASPATAPDHRRAGLVRRPLGQRRQPPELEPGGRRRLHELARRAVAARAARHRVGVLRHGRRARRPGGLRLPVRHRRVDAGVPARAGRP